MALKVGELVALFSGDASRYFATSNKVRADAKELDGMQPTVRPKIAHEPAARAAQAAGKAMGSAVKAGFASAGVGAALASSMAVVAAAVPAAIGLAGAFGVVAAAGKEVADTMSAYNAAQEAAGQGAEAAMQAHAEFAAKMAELTEEGQAFTRQLIEMGPMMDRLGDVAQSSVLPGFTKMLKAGEQLEPVLAHGLEAVGSAMSDTGERAAALVSSPAFQGDLWSAFDNGADIVGALGDMVVDLTGDFVSFAGQAQPATAGMVDMIGSLSDGMSSFLSNAVPGMESYGSILRSVGGILESTLGTAGELMATFANEGAPTIARLEQVWSQLLVTVEQFASSGIGPLMASFGTLLDMLSGLLAVLEPIAPLLGTITGAVLPFIAALRLVDKVSFGSVRKKLSGVGEAIDAAETKRAKFGTGMKGMIGAVLNPWGLAIGAAGFALSLLGQNQQEAAEAASQHASAVQELTGALERDGGVIGANTRQVITYNLAQRKAGENARLLGISMGTVTDAATGNKQAFNTLTGTIDKQIASVIRASDSSNALIDDIQGVGQAEIATSKATEDYIDDLSTWRMNSLDLSDAQRKQLTALLNLKGATWQQYTAAQEAKRIAREQAAAQNGVTVETLKHWRALLKLNAELLKSVNKNLAYRVSLTQLEAAHKRSQEALAKHGRTSLEYRQAVQAEERAIMGVIRATYDRTFAEKKSLPTDKRKIAATKAMQAEAFRLAKTYTGPLPKALAEYIGGMKRSTASAYGAKVATNEAGEAVYKLPNGHTIKIRTNAGAVEGAMHDLKWSVSELDAMSATVDVFYRHYNRTRGVGMGRVVRGAYADGGLVGFPDGGLFRGRGGPRSDSNLIAASDGEFIVNARSTAQNLELLRAINSGQVAGGGEKSTGGASTMSASTFGGDGGSVMDAVIRLGEVTEREWRRLKTAGWQGRAGDRMEALYPPLKRTTDGFVRLGEVTESQWQALRAGGWTGIAGDHMEALYPPLSRLGRAIDAAADGFYSLVPTSQLSGKAKAAQELLGQLASGGNIFEDFTFRGASDNVGRFNDALAEQFYNKYPGFDFGAAGTVEAVRAFLSSVVANGSGQPSAPTKHLSAKGKAARELLNHIANGGRYFEDFSFRGSSANLSKFNDKLADRFYSNRPGFDFGPAGTTAEIRDYLRRVVNRQTTVNVESLTVESYSDRFDYRQVMDELAMQGVS